MATSITVLVIKFWLPCTIYSVCGYEFISQYPNQPNETYHFYHLAVDRVSGQVYAGSLNWIHQLSPDLKPIHVLRTGPILDNPMCHAIGCPSDEIQIKRTDNVNKILVIDQESGRVITCGSVAQGSCTKYKLGDLSATPEFVPVSLAANDADASTYAFIGPERYNSWDQSNVLYVGTTFTNNSEYRHDVPAISSRDLMTLDTAQLTFSKQSAIQIDVKYRDNFLVQYVYGFNASDYAYFLIIQKHSHLAGDEELGYVSRLARICVNDDSYSSYTEVTLECHVREETVSGKSEVVNYNLVQDAKIAKAGANLAAQLGIETGEPVLIASFSPSTNISNEPISKSAICVFSLQEIEFKFNENVHMCFNGSTKERNMGYISGMISDGKCPSVGSTGNLLNFCEVHLKISGLYPIKTMSVINWNDTLITSVTPFITGLHTVAFLGTNNGVLKKVLFDSDKALEYSNEAILPGQSILPDTTLSPNQKTLYVLASNSIVQIPTERCAEHGNCLSCLESKDPHCGWCSLQKRCTVQNMCQNGTQSARWLSQYIGQQCIDFEQVLPDRISMNEVTTLQLIIQTLPELPFEAKYKCVFGNAPAIDATVTSNGLACPTPDVEHRPIIPQNQDHVYVSLSVHSSETNKDFVSRNFAFYDCSKHTTCHSCVLSKWACNWCVYDNRCTHDTSVCQRTIISGENNPTKLLNHGIWHCPTIWQLVRESRDGYSHVAP